MTTNLFLDYPYKKTASATVAQLTQAGGVVLDRSIFYATSGGQPCDFGQLSWAGGIGEVVDVRKSGRENIELILANNDCLPEVGQVVAQELDWERRYRHMKVHTALHLLSVVIPLPVTGGAITTVKGRLDFNMPNPLENRQELEQQLNDLVKQAFKISTEWISDGELAANPGLVKTMSVKPPMNAGRVRLVRIGSGDKTVDLQPCGGTHVKSTAEIGGLRFGKIEKKGRQNRRVNLFVE